VDPLEPARASTLVTTGPNAITRNPMYVGLTGLLVAHAILRGSWPALAPVAGFVAYLDRVQIRAEEKALLVRFGAEYDAYRSQVPRWLGPARGT
jgi:protein-S-isoprenylcysteine O-methyltransferase Ste14